VGTITHSNGPENKLPALSKAERRLIGLVIAGRTNREIAKEVGLVEQTVKNTLSSIYRKCRVRNRTELVLLAFHAGMIPQAPSVRAPD
jgi:two-component system, NarL family, nitrate/nitrite response regulator NarL